MAAALIDETTAALLGHEVAVGDIDRELARFYAGDEEGAAAGGGIARASLLNLAVYTEDAAAAPALSQVVGELTRETACRVILILSDPPGPAGVRSWVQAHCRLSDQGEKTVCTEQLSFWLGGADAGLVRNTVFAHLDSDLPLVFWWRGELSEIFEERLHSRIDRFIFDSASWRQPAAQLLRVQQAIEESGGGLVVHDLAYTRCHPIRAAIARVFDDPPARRALDGLAAFEIVHRPGHRMTALWLAAWIAGRLQGRLNDRGQIETARHGPIGLACRECEAADAETAEAIARVSIDLGPAGRIVIHHAAASGFWLVAQHLSGAPPRERLFPGRSGEVAGLIGEILTRAGRNRAMMEALPTLRQLLAR